MNSTPRISNPVFERPNGFYWVNTETGQEYGPFPDRLSALADMEYDADSNFEPGETLEEAEDEIGMSSWLDPDTGSPAEHITHLEDH